MNTLLKLSITIFILIIVTHIFEQLLVDNKYHKYIKPALCGMVVITILTEITKINFSSVPKVDYDEYAEAADMVWEKVCEESEIIVENHILKICNKINLKVDDVDVFIDADGNDLFIKKISIYGKDSEKAGKAIEQYYNFGSDTIISVEK